MTSGAAVTDRDVIAFAQRWYRYGGGPAMEIASRFGMTQAQYFERLQDALAGEVGAELRPTAKQEIRRVARHRLWFVS